MKRFNDMKRGHAALACALAAAMGIAAAGEVPVDFNGVGWAQYGQIGNSSDTLPNNYNGNPMQNSGAQISVSARINERLLGAVGLGVSEGHVLAGRISGGGRVPIEAAPYISEARFTYHLGDGGKPLLQATGGLFHYNYDQNVKDLGLYLLRGSVYPGFVNSGFETKEVVPIANVLGLWLRNTAGILTNDVLLNSETDLKPYFDLSLVYIGKIRPTAYFTFGAGVNFYRLIPSDAKVSHHPFNAVYETQENQVRTF